MGREHVAAASAPPPNVVVRRTVRADRGRLFAWLADSRTYTRSPVVFSCRWARPGRDDPVGPGAVRDVVMVGGWYREEITTSLPDERIDYRVRRSFPPVRQEFSRITLTEGVDGVEVVWAVRVDLALPILGPLLTPLAARLARVLYGTILTAAATDLVADHRPSPS